MLSVVYNEYGRISFLMGILNILENAANRVGIKFNVS